MQAYLIESGFNFVAANSEFVIVQDPRWNNYRVYSATENPANYANAHIEAPHQNFDLVIDAAKYAGIQ